MKTSFDIQVDRIPSLVTWFNSYVGYAALDNRLSRFEQKLSNGTLSQALLRRFQFHLTYRDLINRKRLGLAPDIRTFAVVDTLSFVASVEGACRDMSSEQRVRLRSRILDGLSPDSDIRRLQHELRAFVHYKRAGCRIDWLDSDADRFDFLIHGPNGPFEVECKTFAENIGNAVSVDDSFFWFDQIQRTLKRSAFPPSGTFEIKTIAGVRPTQAIVAETIQNFLRCLPTEKQYDVAIVRFARRPDFDQLAGRPQREALLLEFAKWQSKDNHHCMVATDKKSVLFFSLHSSRPPRPYNAICDSLKRAANQFSGTRPAVIWGHFLGLTEENMRELLERNQGGRTALDVFGHYLFKNDARNHVCRLRLSADGDRLQGSGKEMVRGGGPAYDLNSVVSKFDHKVADENLESTSHSGGGDDEQKEAINRPDYRTRPRS